MRKQNKFVVILILSLFMSFIFVSLVPCYTCFLTQPANTSHSCCQSDLDDDCKSTCRCDNSDFHQQEISDNTHRQNGPSFCLPLLSKHSLQPLVITANPLTRSIHNSPSVAELLSLYCTYRC